MSAWLETISGHAAKWLVTRPRHVALTLGVLVLTSVALLPTLKLESGTRVFVADDDPAQTFLTQIEREFVSDDVIFVAYEAPTGVFSHAALRAVRTLGEQFTALGPELVDDVVSLATVKDLRGGEGTFRSVALVPDEVPTDAAQLADLEGHARSNWLIREGLLSKSNPAVAAMLVRLQRGATDEVRARVVREVRAILAASSGAAGLKTYVTGGPVIESDSVTLMQVDLKRFIPVTYAMLTLLIALFTRRVAGVALAFVNASVAVLFGMAVLAVFGSLTNLSTVMPPMLMVLSVATVVHFLTEYARNTQLVGPARAAEVSLRELLVPAFMCELTTAVGFLSFACSRIPAMRQFGVAAAIAVMGAFGSSFLVIALATKYLAADRLISSTSVTSGRVEAAVRALTELAIRRPKAMLAVMVGLTVISAVGLGWFRVNHSTVDQFTGALPIRLATDLVNAELGGSNELIVSVRTTQANRFMEPEELEKLAALQRFLEADVKATMTTSVADHVRLMNRAFNEDAPNADRLPARREQVAQLALLNGDDRLFQFVNRSWSWARIAARTPESGSADLMHRFDQIQRYLAANFSAGQGYDARVTGATHLDVVMSDNILDGQVTSFLISFALIFLPIIMVFGSVTAGAFTIPSNLFPVLACMGVMGWVGIPLDVGTSMTTSIILGIAVDDTIHFIQSMRHGLAQHQDLERAVRETMATKGVGALWITLIITLGFVTLVGSNFKVTFNFGLITAFAMVAGVVAEMLLLPPLIVLTQTRLGVPRGPAPEATPAAGATRAGAIT